MAYLSPKTIIVDFLRKNITDPRGRITSKINTTASAAVGQTTFQLVPTTGKSYSYIDTVTIDAVTSVKWRDFYIDPKKQQIIFFTAMAGGEEVIITFGETSSDWIFPDKATKKLDALSFPRMNVLIVSDPGVRVGNYEAPVEAIPRVQIDVWAKEKQDNQIFTIGGDEYTGADLAEYLSYKITEAFEDNEGNLFPALYGYDPVGMAPDLPFDDELQCHHKVVEFICRGLSIGRIS